jgi:hypothetical protein
MVAFEKEPAGRRGIVELRDAAPSNRGAMARVRRG